MCVWLPCGLVLRTHVPLELPVTCSPFLFSYLVHYFWQDKWRRQRTLVAHPVAYDHTLRPLPKTFPMCLEPWRRYLSKEESTLHLISLQRLTSNADLLVLAKGPRQPKPLSPAEQECRLHPRAP